MKKRDVERVEDLNPRRPIEVKNLYEVFSSYKVRIPLFGCPCCVAEADVARLHAKPLERLDADILDRFIWSATSTWGELSDFKHFVPRILELTLTREFDLWILHVRLESTKWREWPDEETLAIRSFLHFAWRQFLSKSDADALDDWLQLFSKLQEPIIDLLWAWAKSENAQMRCSFAEWIARGQWQEEKVGNIDQFFTQELVDYLESQFFENADSPCADNFAQAVDLVKSLALWKKRHEN